MRLAYERKRPAWIPFTYEVRNFNPRIFTDNRSRAMIQEARPASPSEYGGPDMFGVPWVFDPASGGSMVAPGNPLLTELADWEKTIVFPDPASWDWDGCAAENAGYFDTELPVKLTIFTGLFERLISFMDFEPAIITLIDEDEQAPGYDAAPFMINTADIRWLDEPDALAYTSALYKYGRMAMDKN